MENGPAVTIDVLANDLAAGPGDLLEVVSLDAGSIHGQVSIAPDGATLVYSVGSIPELEAGQVVTESFLYNMRYGGGKLATATVTVAVTGENHALQTTDDTFEATEDALTVIPVLDNDADMAQWYRNCHEVPTDVRLSSSFPPRVGFGRRHHGFSGDRDRLFSSTMSDSPELYIDTL